jgi:hypothetical protein
MAEKKTKKEVKPADKKVSDSMERHPMVENTARGLFRNENGTTIVQERVPRGDLPQDDVIMPRNEFDLTGEDLDKIASEAKKAVDPVLAKYDEDVAMEDALSRTIWTKDGSKYQGRLSASTQALVLEKMKGGKKEAPKKESDKKASDVTPVEDVEAADIDNLVSSIPTSMADIEKAGKKTPKEAGMDKEMLRKEANDLAKKLDALKVLLGEDEEHEEHEKSETPAEEAKEHEKDAGSKKGPGKPDGTGPHAGTPQCQLSEDKDAEDSSLVASLDEVAEMVEKEARDKQDMDLFRIAYQIDCVSDYLSGTKDAATLQSDPDEKFMREAFKAGVKQRDSDEKFMDEFKNDNTMESRRVVGKVSVQEKKASELPYAVKKDA